MTRPRLRAEHCWTPQERKHSYHLTRYQPLLPPAQAADGRWTTDEWSPSDGRVVDLGLRWRFGGEDTDADRDIKR